MPTNNNLLFQEAKLGPKKLKNRTIRAAAFEGMCPNGIPSDSLIKYHSNVAKGGIGMTTVAYVSVTNGGRTFSHQAWMNEAVVKGFKRLTEAVHKNGSLASVQLGHAGNMGDKKISGERAIAPSSVFNLFGLTFPRKMSEVEILDMVKSYGNAVQLSIDAGFDAVEIHAGHGYLISQFISPYTNRRKDKWGGSFENRVRFLRLVMREVKKVAGNKIAVVVKTNLTDGFKGGMNHEEGLKVAKVLEEEGADALVLSGGFVSKSSFFMMKGRTPHKELIRNQKSLFIKLGMIFFSRIMLEDYPYKEAFFLDEAMNIRDNVSIPLVYVGGAVSRKTMEDVLAKGFDFIQLARPLFYETDYINKIKENPQYISKCLTCGDNEPSNSCVATMYNGEAQCPFREE